MNATHLIFDEATHTYWHKGRQVPGVTSILAPLTDLSSVPPDVLAAASAFGTAVHKACELWDLGDLDVESLDPALEPYLCAWQKFSEEHKVKWTGIEQRVFHQTLRYAGTLDRAGTVDGRLAIVDIKSTADLYPSIGPQLAAYRGAAIPSAVRDCARLAVRLKPDGSYELREYSNPADFSVFAGLLSVRNWCAQHQITPKF